MREPLYLPLRPTSSGKGLGRVCGRFQGQVPVGTKNLPVKKMRESLYFLNK